MTPDRAGAGRARQAAPGVASTSTSTAAAAAAPRLSKQGTAAVASSDSDNGAISDGDPPGYRAPTAGPGPATAAALTQQQRANQNNGTSGSKPKRKYEELEEVTFSNPAQFTAMAFGIAASRGTALVVSDDRTTKNFAPYLHMCCLFRKSGCPFILRLVKAKEGGWVLKASTSTDVELKQRSVYRCRHAAGMTASQPPVALAPAPATPSLPGPPLPQSTGLFSPVLAPTPPPPTLPAPASASAPLPPDKPKRGPGRPRKIKPPVVSSDDDDDEEENYYKPIKHAVAAIPRPAKIRSSMASSKFTKPAPPPAPGTEGFDREKILAPPFQRSISISALIVPALSPNVNAGRIEKAPVLREKPKPDQRPPAPDAFKSFLPPRALAYRPSILGPPPTVSPYNRKADEPPSKTLELWTAFLVALDPSLVIPFAAILSSSTIDVSPEAFFGEGVEMRVALINELKGVGQWAIVRLRSKVVARGEDVWRTISNSEPRAAGSDEIASVGVKVDRKGKGREIVQDEAPPASNGPVPMDLDQSAALQLSPPQATPFTFPFELVPEDQPPPPASTTPKPILPAADSPAATQPVDDEFLVRLRPSEPKPPALSIGRTPSPSDEPDFSEVEVEVDPSLDGEEIDLDGAVVEQLAGDEEAMDTGESSGNESPAQDGDTDGSALVITSAVASPTEATPTGLAGALESVVFRATRERKRKAEMESPALVKAKKAVPPPRDPNEPLRLQDLKFTRIPRANSGPSSPVLAVATPISPAIRPPIPFPFVPPLGVSAPPNFVPPPFLPPPSLQLHIQPQPSPPTPAPAPLPTPPPPPQPSLPFWRRVSNLLPAPRAPTPQVAPPPFQQPPRLADYRRPSEQPPPPQQHPQQPYSSPYSLGPQSWPHNPSHPPPPFHGGGLSSSFMTPPPPAAPRAFYNQQSQLSQSVGPPPMGGGGQRASYPDQQGNFAGPPTIVKGVYERKGETRRRERSP